MNTLLRGRIGTVGQKDHFLSYREHTKIKHAILKDYLSAWIPILGSWNKKICYIDGFCGPGYYVDGKAIRDGSPIIALRIAEGFSDKVEVICLFIDKKEDYCEKLENRIKELDIDVKCYIECGEFGKVVTELLKDVPNIVPAFCFIDPFGYSGLPLHVIKKFLRRQSTEVFINFMYGPVSRFINVSSQHSHLDELFGTPEWKYVLRRDLRRREKEILLRDLYHKQLQTCANYVLPFKLKDPERDATMYYLFHCTNHPKGIKVMKEVMYRKGTIGTYSYLGKDSSQITLFSTEPNISELEEHLLEEFAGQEIQFDSIIDSNLDSPFIEKHFRQALNNLKERQIIRKIPITTRGQRGFSGEDIAVFPTKTMQNRRSKRSHY